MRSILPRLLCLCCILVAVMVGSGYVMYSQLAAGYVPIKPGTAHFSTVARQAAAQHRTTRQAASMSSAAHPTQSQTSDAAMFEEWCNRMSPAAKARCVCARSQQRHESAAAGLACLDVRASVCALAGQNRVCNSTSCVAQVVPVSG